MGLAAFADIGQLETAPIRVRRDGLSHEPYVKRALNQSASLQNSSAPTAAPANNFPAPTAASANNSPAPIAASADNLNSVNTPATNQQIATNATSLTTSSSSNDASNNHNDTHMHHSDRIGWIGGIIVSLVAIFLVVGVGVRYQQVKKRKMRAENHAALWTDGLGPDEATDEDKQKKEKKEKKDKDKRGRNERHEAQHKKSASFSKGLKDTTSSSDSIEETTTAPKSRLLGSFSLRSFATKPPMDMSLFKADDPKKDGPVDTFQMEIRNRERQSKVIPPLPTVPRSVLEGSAQANFGIANHHARQKSFPASLSDDPHSLTAHPLQTHGFLDPSSPHNIPKKARTRGPLGSSYPSESIRE